MNAPPGMPPEAFWIAVCIGGAIGLLIGLTIQIFFLMTLTNTLKQVAERNRQIEPRTVWLTIVINFIPVVGPIWSISLVNRLSSSIRREFEDRGWNTESEGFARTPGLLWAWGALLYVPLNAIQLYLQFSGDMKTATMISLLSMPVSLGLLVCFIMYWIFMYQYGKRLRERRRRRNDTEADYDDQLDRPARDDDNRERPHRDDTDPFHDDRARS